MLHPDMADTAKSARDFDIVIWGASGFTGRLVAEHLLQAYGTGESLRWAIAGRNREKLACVRQDLGSAAGQIEILIGDCDNPESLAAIARRARVICTTVGPYLKFGAGMLAACAENSTDYCDITGEVLFIRRMIDTWEQSAINSGARIVNSCGFDSIPSDVGTWFMQREFKKKFGHYASEVRFRLKVAKGALSGGTIDSLLNIIDTVRADATQRELLGNPYALNPDPGFRGCDGEDQAAAAYDELFGAWTAPFIMAGINTRIVRRSNAINGYPWGRDFSYSESVLAGKGVKGWLRARLISAGLKTFVLAASIPVTRALMFKLFLPRPGEGPTAEQRRSGFFNIAFLATDAAGHVLRGKLTGDRDPGYGATSKMLGEMAVCLASDLDPRAGGGFLTPAVAGGEKLMARLRDHAGISITVIDPD
jgi:short subunit dehydrogenase-like uncharacterized protein